VRSLDVTKCAAHRISLVSREIVRGMSEKEDGLGHRPCEESRAPCSVSVRRGYVAEVDRQSPGPKYARTQRSKKSGGTSERGPSRARIAVCARKRGSIRNSGRANGELVRRLSRSNEGHERPAETQDGVRTSFSGLRG